MIKTAKVINYKTFLKMIQKEGAKIVITFMDWGYSKAYGSYFPYLNAYVLLDNEFYKLMPDKNEKDMVPYWNEKKGAFQMSVWGTDRLNELKSILTMDIPKEIAKKIEVIFI